jgi:hypothetical protein
MRHLLIRDESGIEHVVDETELLAEKSLHDVLTGHPELIPAEDLEISPPVVVGRESGLDAGYADLVLLDRSAQLCLVEVKKEGNPDTRRVVAQLLDYAAALWQMSAATFEQVVLHPYLRSTGLSEADLPGLAEFAAEQFEAVEGDGESDEFYDFSRRLEENLAGGKFRLVVAAPGIPPGVRQVIEYLNAQGLLIYGLEVSFFSGPAECFVPRLVVRPRVAETRKLASAISNPIAQEDFLQWLPQRIHKPVLGFLDDAETTYSRVTWASYGPGVRVQRTPERIICYLEKKRISIRAKPFAAYPEEPFAVVLTTALKLPVGSVSKDGNYWSTTYEELSDDNLRRVFEIALGLVAALGPRVAFEAASAPLEMAFQRNDNNIWIKAIPILKVHTGHWLRGILATDSAGKEVRVTLEPLAGGSPGWKPRFDSAATAQSIWPIGEFNGDYRLTITEVGTPDIE